MARLTKIQRAISTVNREYVVAFRQWEGTEKASRGTDECAADFRCAVPHLRRSALAAWDRLVKVSGDGTPEERTAFAWVIGCDEFAPSRMF
jgi:hypothetical protein